MFFDLFSKKKPSDEKEGMAKEDIFKMFLEQQAQRSPSDQFASGAVFDISRQQRELFCQAIRSNNVPSLKDLFTSAYFAFLSNPEIVGFAANMVNRDNNDTDPRTWNMDAFSTPAGDCVVLLYMPIQNSTLAARIIGIVFSDKGDGYYYCMLNKDEATLSDVNRNNAIYGTDKAGEVKGSGLELMDSFLDCILSDFYREM